MSPDSNVMVIYGGTFDPFHRGHEAICHAILQYSFVTQLRLIPCHIPALKAQAEVTGAQRLQMLYQWQQYQSERLLVDPIEINRTGLSYTLDTLSVLSENHPNTRIILAMGMDAWQGFTRWHGYDELRHLVNVWVFSRLGQAQLAPLSGWTRVEECQALLQTESAHYFVDPSVKLDISSTLLRNNRESLEAQVPESIFNYIQENNLYRSAHPSP